MRMLFLAASVALKMLIPMRSLATNATLDSSPPLTNLNVLLVNTLGNTGMARTASDVWTHSLSVNTAHTGTTSSIALIAMETIQSISCLRTYQMVLQLLVDVTLLTLFSHTQHLTLPLTQRVISALLAQLDSLTAQLVLTTAQNVQSAKMVSLRMLRASVRKILAERKMNGEDALNAILKETQELSTKLKTTPASQSVENFMFKHKMTGVSFSAQTDGSKTFMSAENVMFKIVSTALMMENASSVTMMRFVS